MATEDPDPDVLSRWIGVLSLLASAHEMAARGSGPWPRLALATADTATEAVLGLLAAEGTKPVPEKAGFEEVLDLAAAVLVATGPALPSGLRTRIRAAHRLRNLAVHHGGEPSQAEVARALVTAEAVRAMATHRSPLLEAFRTAGPATAVARIIGVEDVGSRLLAAEEATRADDAIAALDEAAVALDVAISRIRPRLRPAHPSRPHEPRPRSGRIEDPGLQLASQVAEYATKSVDQLRQRQELQEDWIVALGLGASPISLARLRRVLGRPTRFMDGHIDVYRDDKIEVTLEVADRALLEVADLVFRLWAGGSLYAGDPYKLRDEPD